MLLSEPIIQYYAKSAEERSVPSFFEFNKAEFQKRGEIRWQKFARKPIVSAK
jgi:hypothetical protein